MICSSSLEYFKSSKYFSVYHKVHTVINCHVSANVFSSYILLAREIGLQIPLLISAFYVWCSSVKRVTCYRDLKDGKNNEVQMREGSCCLYL